MAATSSTPTNLVDMLRRRAERQDTTTACVYLADGEDVRTVLTFGELDRHARAVAARLQGLGASGECAILLYPPGMEFISAFFGCLYAGVIAVPLPVPRLKASMTQFLGLVEELGARIVMTTAATGARLRRMDTGTLERLAWLATEDTQSELARAWRPDAITSDTVAYLQYTSGSTSNRKGVVIRHGNVTANLLGIAERFRHHENSVSVNWLPHTHDLGLVSGMLQPLYHGHLGVLMSPTAFVQQPIRWLNAFAQFRGTYASSPNFGYDLCVRRITPEQRVGLDLSSWEVALNGAEPVRRQTIDDFAVAFAACGFRREVMYPAYGLAEATLVVSGGLRDAVPVTLQVDATHFERGRIVEARNPEARPLVGCGHALDATMVAIVAPDTCKAVAPGDIGEIWVRGPGVASGYWHREAETEQTFGAQLVNGNGERYLRTGDLGFLHGRELFIAGRLKDLIIVRGANHHPQDIEWTIEQCHEAFRPGCGAAFSIEAEGTERLIVAFEVEREHLRALDADAGELAHIARRAVSEQHDLHLHTLVLLRTGTVPRTTSGKIQRGRCRSGFLNGDLAVVWQSADGGSDDSAPEISSPTVRGEDRPPSGAASEFCGWLRDYAEHHLNSRLMDERRSISPHVLLEFGNRGIMGLQVPKAYGGLALGYRDAMTIIQQLGAIDQTLAMMTIVHNSLGIRPILSHASATLKADLLPRLASGRELAAFALTEPDAGSNPQAIKALAIPDAPGGWRLRGQKSWSGSAGWAGVINIFVHNIDSEGRLEGMSGFVVPRNTAGIRMGAEALTLGMRAMVQNTIHLDGARVTRDQVLGDIGSGMKVAQHAMMEGRLAIGAACVGGMKRCLQLLLRYAGRRSISTGRLLDNPVLLERVGALSAALHAVEMLVRYIADRLDRNEEVPPDAYIVCKMAGSEWFWRGADDLVQLLGGRGYIETNVAAQLLRDARVTRILEGPTEALGMFLGSRVANDSAAMQHLIGGDLQAPDVAARLARVAGDILARCARGHPRFGESHADGRRWAYAIIGQVAVDAVLLAATPNDRSRHYRAWAEQRFESSIAAALSQSDGGAFRVNAPDISAIVDGYVDAIGDVEQSLPGEDHAMDHMLKRGEGRRLSSVVASPSAAIAREQPAAMPGPTTSAERPLPNADAPVATVAPGPIDAATIERFIMRRMAVELKMPDATLDPTRSLFDYGVDSVTAVLLTASLEEWLGVEISPEMLYDVSVIRALAAHVARQQAASRVAAPSA